MKRWHTKGKLDFMCAANKGEVCAMCEIQLVQSVMRCVKIGEANSMCENEDTLTVLLRVSLLPLFLLRNILFGLTVYGE